MTSLQSTPREPEARACPEPRRSTGSESTGKTADDRSTLLSRRTLILGSSLAAAAAIPLSKRLLPKESVFVARNQSYEKDLSTTIRDGLLSTGLDPSWLPGKRVLLKPNLVEPQKAIPHMTTHPSVIIAAADVFRRWGATVRVGEGPGHVRDTEIALHDSGVGEALDSAELDFCDLNYEEVKWTPNKGRNCKLDGFYFPQSVCEADLLVSMPKMKTHHWVGLTASMKNLYGIIPGIKYGWPKNVLHHNGIPQTVVDINASAPRTVTIVDGIDCMEGDGPILGSKKWMGLILVGQNLPAVDATAARIMGLRPELIDYLQLAHRLGPVDQYRIRQTGEAWSELVSPFKILDRPHLRFLRTREDGPLVT